MEKEEKMGGWVRVPRSLLEDENYAVLQFGPAHMMLDLMLLASPEDTKELGRGEFPFDVHALAQRWGCTPWEAEGFLGGMAAEGKLELGLRRKALVGRLTEYDKAQGL